MADDLDILEDESVELDSNYEDNSSSNGTENSGDVDAFLSTDSDLDQLGKAEGNLFLETGNYKWKDNKVNIKVEFNDNDKKPTDTMIRNGKNRGRAHIIVSGIVVNKESKKEGIFNFMMSPDTRTLDDGRDDFMTQNYARFSAFYYKQYEKKVTNASSMVKFIESCKYSLYITRGKNGGNFLNRVQDI